MLAAALLAGAWLVLASAVQAVAPYEGRLIALDAGHGGTESGAVNASTSVAEKDVNLATVYALKWKLEAAGAKVVLTREGDETITSRKQRVQIAQSKCNALAGRNCDILVSIHHNGSTDPTHNGTLVIYNERQDVPLARALHDALVPLTGIDEGYLSGGYGITVYGHLVSALTEAYYITNDSEADLYLRGAVCGKCGGTDVRIGERVQEEAQAQYVGIGAYFTNTGSGKGRNK